MDNRLGLSSSSLWADWALDLGVSVALIWAQWNALKFDENYRGMLPSERMKDPESPLFCFIFKYKLLNSQRPTPTPTRFCKPSPGNVNRSELQSRTSVILLNGTDFQNKSVPDQTDQVAILF